MPVYTYLGSFVKEVRCNIEIILASSTASIPHTIKGAVLCFAWCIQVQCLDYLYSALIVHCTFR